MSGNEIKHVSSDIIEPSVEPVEDKLYRLASMATALVSSVDFGVSGELFRAFVEAPSERRTRQAIKLLTEALNEIIDRINRPLSQLQGDEAFVSTMATAYSMASRTADPEKLVAIKQVVISSALDNAPEEAVQQMYLATLSDMTSIHLRLLGYFKSLNYTEVKTADTGDRDVQNSYFEKVKTYLSEGTLRPVVERATRDLHSWGVIAVPEGCPEALPGPNFIVMMLTDFGKGLMEFIEI